MKAKGVLILLILFFVFFLLCAEDIHKVDTGVIDGLKAGAPDKELNNPSLHDINKPDQKLKEDKMGDNNKNKETIPEKNKVPGVAYAFTDCGLELAVLDITHPLFIKSINEEGLAELCKQSALLAERAKAMPEAQRNAINKVSLMFGEHFHREGTDYLSGMSTYMLKLGPYLLGGGEERNLDRMLAMGVSSVSARMRLRDICRMQADVLVPHLTASPKKDICLINIAGGAAGDSINTLILILKENPSLLKNRRIAIDVFDIDSESPNFGRRCIEALKAPGFHFHGLDISYNHIKYDWADTKALTGFLSKRKDSIISCTTEGGLFEYAADEHIIANLNALYDNSPQDTRITGSLFYEIDKVDPTIPAMAEVSGGGLRFLGLAGFEKVLQKTKWKVENTIKDKNPVYIIATLKK